jgi:hypothetical protein
MHRENQNLFCEYEGKCDVFAFVGHGNRHANEKRPDGPGAVDSSMQAHEALHACR